jgi:hypothetical protein
MRAFRDSKERSWQIRLTLGSVMAVKDAVGVDLLAGDSPDPDAQAPNLLTRLSVDLLLCGRVIAAMLAEQFEAHETTEAEVLAAFDAATLAAAREAFFGELLDFYRGLGRTDLVEQIEATGEAIAATVEANVQRIRGLRSGERPAPSASAPTS